MTLPRRTVIRPAARAWRPDFWKAEGHERSCIATPDRPAPACQSRLARRPRPRATAGRTGTQGGPVAGLRLAELGIPFELTLCSSAARTRETWKLAAHELPHRPRTVYEERLYDATLGDLIALLNETPEDVDDLLLVGHNPTIHALADALAGRATGTPVRG